MDNPPYWILAGIYWFHMIATVTWGGSLMGYLLFYNLFVIQDSQNLNWGIKLRHFKIVNIASWLSLGALIPTGLFQMSAHPSYLGLMSIANDWAYSLLIKHLLRLCLIFTQFSMTFSFLPMMNRQRILAGSTKQNELTPVNKILGGERKALLLAMILFVLILLFTGLARAS